MSEDWIHTEILKSRERKSPLITSSMAIMLFVALILFVIAFRGLFIGKPSESSQQEREEETKVEESLLPPKGELKEEKDKEEQKVVYVVKAGDTLAGIGAEFGVDWQKIAEANNIPEPYNLSVGQELTMPGVKPKEEEKPEEEEKSKKEEKIEEGQFTSYTVKSGDTLGSIGAQFGIDWQKIAEVNGISEPYLLSVGQVLKIPKK